MTDVQKLGAGHRLEPSGAQPVGAHSPHQPRVASVWESQNAHHLGCGRSGLMFPVDCFDKAGVPLSCNAVLNADKASISFSLSIMELTVNVEDSRLLTPPRGWGKDTA